MASFEAAVTLPCGLDDVFEFLRRPMNMTKISPPKMGLSLVSAPEFIELGSRVEFKIHGFGTVQHVIHEITEFNEPRHFTEQQVKGPLKRWMHEHLLEIDGGHVMLIDRIAFEPPGGLVGLLVTESKILDQLEDTFDHQHEALKKHFEAIAR